MTPRERACANKFTLVNAQGGYRARLWTQGPMNYTWWAPPNTRSTSAQAHAQGEGIKGGSGEGCGEGCAAPQDFPLWVPAFIGLFTLLIMGHTA